MNGESDRKKYGEIKSHRKTQSKIVERDTLEKAFEYYAECDVDVSLVLRMRKSG